MKPTKTKPVRDATRRIALSPTEKRIFRRYTRIKDRKLVQLNVSTRDTVQTFTLDVRPDTVIEADFFRKMLARAISKIIVVEVLENIESSKFKELYDEAH